MHTEWTLIKEAVARFEEFLATAQEYAPITCWHVIFNMGTVARVDDSLPEFFRFPRSYIQNYPIKCISATYTKNEIIQKNIEVFESQSTYENPLVAAAIKRAFELLISDGFPDEGDRDPKPLDIAEEPLWNVHWIDREPLLTNLAIAEDPIAACASVKAMRRIDYGMPLVAAVISPELIVWHFDRREY